MAIKESTCKFCGRTMYQWVRSGRWYEADGKTFHVKNCPKRAKHFHEKAMDTKEGDRQDRFDEYNRRGTESSEGRRFAEGWEMLNDEDDE